MLHWRRIKVYARSVWDVIIIITAFCLANDGHLLFSVQWLQKPLGGSWWEVLTRGWLIYWASSSPLFQNSERLWTLHVSSPLSPSTSLFIPPFSLLLSRIIYQLLSLLSTTFTCSLPHHFIYPRAFMLCP